MGTMAKRRAAAAATVLFLILYLMQVLVTAAPAGAVAPDPVYAGGIAVDGDPSDWNETDFFADLILGGGQGENKPVLLAKSYVRYDCASATLFVLVLAEPDHTVDDSTGDAWVKLEEFGPGESTDQTQFAWVLGEDGVTILGYEAAVDDLPEGTYTVEIHMNVDDGETASTGKSGTPLVIDCAEVDHVTVSVEVGSCAYGEKGSQTPVTVTINPDSGATVTIYDADDNEVGTFNGAGGSVDLAPGDYWWDASVDEGYQLVGDSSGEFMVDDCTPPPTSSSTTSTTTTTAAPIPVTIAAGCPTEGAVPAMTVNPAGGATVNLVDAGDGVFSWTAVAAEGYVIESGATGTFDLKVCADVLGTTIISTTSTTAEVLGTAVAAVTASTLPFTGFEMERTLMLALAALMVGAGLLLVAYGTPERKMSTIADRW